MHIKIKSVAIEKERRGGAEKQLEQSLMFKKNHFKPINKDSLQKKGLEKHTLFFPHPHITERGLLMKLYESI